MHFQKRWGFSPATLQQKKKRKKNPTFKIIFLGISRRFLEHIFCSKNMSDCFPIFIDTRKWKERYWFWIVALLGSRTISPMTIAPRKTAPWTIAPQTIATQDNCPPDNCHLRQFPLRTITPWTTAPGQFPPRTITPWTIPSGKSHSEILCCPRIITPGQLLPRAMTIANYIFFMAIFCFCFFLLNYIISVFRYDNKNNTDNSNKTWSLKLWSVIIL